MDKSVRKATLIGLLAIPVWSVLPVLTVLAGAIPPLELVALTFTLGASVGAPTLVFSRAVRVKVLSLGALPIAIGIAGLFGYHLAFFLAIQNAPAIEANLIDYLWPVLIVLFSAALPASAKAGPLSFWHLLGALISFAGAALAITAGGSFSFAAGNVFGFGMAFVAALVWSSYSVITRLFHETPSSAVTLYCAGTAALAWIAHAISEPFILPAGVTQLGAIVALGLGPVGSAFYVWDYGCKQGDIRVLGVAAYFSPLLGTALLVETGLGVANSLLWLAAILTTAGALVASKDFIAEAFRR